MKNQAGQEIKIIHKERRIFHLLRKDFKLRQEIGLNIVRKEALTHQRNPKFGRLRKHFNKLRQGLVLLASNQPTITELTEDHAVHSSVRESFVAKTMIFHCLVKKYG